MACELKRCGLITSCGSGITNPCSALQDSDDKATVLSNELARLKREVLHLSSTVRALMDHIDDKNAIIHTLQQAVAARDKSLESSANNEMVLKEDIKQLRAKLHYVTTYQDFHYEC